MRSLLTAIVCIVFINWAGMLAAEGQTDWSGGPGAAMQSGDWDSRFAESEGISSVAIPGQIALSSTAIEAPSATVIGDNLGAAYGLYAVDMDRDGDMDVIGTTDTSAGVFLWVNHGGDPVTWERRDVDLDYPGGTSVHPADVDGDGDLDIIGAAQTPGHNVSWWRNDGGERNWTRFLIDDFVPVACNVFARDVDGDGDVDALSTSWSLSTLSWWRNDGGQPIEWTKFDIKTSFRSAHSAFAEDVDGDLDVDVVGTAANDNTVSLFVNQGGDPIVWEETVLCTDMVGVRYATIGDIDGDGRPDIAATGADGKVVWWRNTGNGWARQDIDDACLGGHFIVVTDVDGDGVNDVLVTAYQSEVILWFGNGGGAEPEWTRHMVAEELDSPLTAVPADVDGDGSVEIIGTVHGSGMISWWDVGEFVAEGALLSSVLDSGEAAEWSSFSWSAKVPPETRVVASFRTSNDAQDMGDWIEAQDNPLALNVPPSRFVQYRIQMSTEDPGSSPILHEIRMSSTAVFDQAPVDETNQQ